MYRIITVSREYGSGGAAIAAAIARRLAWQLFDKAFVSEAARTAKVEPALARAYDERMDSWIHRVSKHALWRGAFEGIAPVSGSDFFDSETMAALTQEIILQVAEQGNCVIVGRGAQCLLRDRNDVLHVCIYAPMAGRLARLRSRFERAPDLERLAEQVDRDRSEFIRSSFGCDWKDPHLYHLMINSAIGEARAIDAILVAAGLAQTAQGGATNA